MKSFYETSHNPIYCSSLGSQSVVHSSYTNTLIVSVFLKKLETPDEENAAEFPHFEFAYTTEPFCGNQYTQPRNSLISFSSLQSIPDEHQQQCQNTISTGRDRKVVLYKLDWLNYNINAGVDETKDEIDLSYLNGRVVCNGSDSLIISDQNPKYVAHKSIEDDPSDLYNVFCMANPFRYE
jgi:hypothetical protein